MPHEQAAHGASGTYFFDRQGLRASLIQSLKNEEQSRAPPKTRKCFTNLSVFLISRTFGFDSHMSQPHSFLFRNLFSIL